ncbi:MAG: hypothetical protein DRJ09_03045 [Bacteroidetes bacterium]|nr:MAG: hypothetical protein DRJ09_03045 [Bacteroidota bacterium]
MSVDKNNLQEHNINTNVRLILKLFKVSHTKVNVLYCKYKLVYLMGYYFVLPYNLLLKYSGIVKCVNEMKKSGKTGLPNSEKKFKLIFENSPHGIYMATKDGAIIEANKALLSILGFPSIEATKTINVLTFPPLMQNGYADKFRLCVELGETIEFETPYKTKWGKETYLHSYLVPLKNEEGNVENVYTLINDISHRKRSEKLQQVLYNISNAVITAENLQAMIGIIQTELSTLIDTTNFFVALYDAQTDTISLPFYSDELDHFNSFPAKKTITRYVIKTKKPLLAKLDQLVALEKKGEIERHGTDSLVWLGVPLKVSGKITGAIVVQSYTNAQAFDEKDKEMLEFVSDQIGMVIYRKNIEELVKKSKQRFELAMKASNDGLYDWDLVTNKIYYSPRWKSILGYQDHELSNNIETWNNLTDQKSRDASLLRLKEAVENKTDHYNVEFKMKHKDGHWVPILSRAHIIFDQQGKAIRAVGTHFDLTEQIKAQEKIKTALKKAEESDRLKSAFLANMSHEIRTPMNGILGFTSLLEEQNLPQDKINRYVKIINRSGNRLLNIINNLIDISKIEARQMEVSLETYDLNEQLHYLFEFFKPETDKKNLMLSVSPDVKNKPLLINSDKEKVYAILTNLVKNSIKYTHKGEIKFGYVLKEDGRDRVIEFFVKDTGIGILPDRQEAVFDRFVQADIEDKKAYEGAGLGLAISKAYVEMLGGKIWLDSDETGTRFYFTLPLTVNHLTKSSPTSQTTEKKTDNPTPKLNKILIAEDEDVSFNYLSILLKHFNNLEILRAYNGIEVIDLMKKHPDINLVLMDIKMPIMSGYDASIKIRKFNKRVVIIAQTAFALESDREKILKSGCNDYISKPINKTELIFKIEKWL